MIVRPASLADLPALLLLARSAGAGLTTLPADAGRLGQRLEWAHRTFAGQAERADTDYLFVLEDSQCQVVGICALAGAVGMREPWYNYRLGSLAATSRALGINRQLPTLFLGNDMTGHSELCSLFLHAGHRNGLNGRLLSKARFLFLAEYRQHFGDKVIAEMRGYCDEHGVSPFWEAVGRHFFKMDFAAADHLTGLGNKTFIAELMPKFPLPTCLLPEAARAVIGRVHPNTEPALGMLKAEGFGFRDYIDIFDGGPLIECATGDIRAVRDSQVLQLGIGIPGDQAKPYLIHNRQFAECRITAAPARVAAGTLIVEAASAHALGLGAGASVRAVSLAVPARQRQVA